MFQPFSRLESTGDPIRDGELDKARLETRLPINEMLAALVLCALIIAAIIWPHTTAMFVGKFLNALIFIFDALGRGASAIAHS